MTGDWRHPPAVDVLDRTGGARFGVLFAASALLHGVFWMGVQVATASPLQPAASDDIMAVIEWLEPKVVESAPVESEDHGPAGGGSPAGPIDRPAGGGGPSRAAAPLPVRPKDVSRVSATARAVDDPYAELVGAQPAAPSAPSAGAERGLPNAAVAGAGGTGGGGAGLGAGGGAGLGGGGGAGGAGTATTVGRAPTNAHQVLSFGAGMTRPARISGRDPAYTREALAARVEGTMVVRCTITTHGALQQCETLKSLPHMREAVLDALATHRYTPVTFEGRAVAVRYVFNVKLAMPR